MPARSDEFAYLTIVATPPGLAWGDFLDLLARESGLDRLTVQQRLARQPPQILCRLDPAESEVLMRRLRSLSVDAINITQRRLAAMGQPMLVKYMRQAQGGYGIDIWRGPSTYLPVGTIQTIIRASVHTETRSGRPSLALGQRLARGTGGYSFVRTPHRVGDAADSRPIGRREYRIEQRSSELIDVHTDSGLWFRISGDKFAWHILGRERGMSDRVNADRFAQRLASEAPQAIFDEFYKLFKPPPGAFMKGLDMVAFGTTHAQGLGMFDFYSRWACVVYRYVAGLR